MLENKGFNPVFLVGHSRSGSTLLASIMSEHSQIFSLPETHFFPKTYAANLFEKIFSKKSHNQLVSRLYKNNRIKDIELTKYELEAYLDGNLVGTYCDLFQCFLEACLVKSKKNRVLEKTPRHIEYVEKIYECFPTAKVICIVRDGRDAVQSLVNAPWTHSNKERHAAYWTWCVRESFRLERKFPEKFKLFRYEDLLIEPVEFLKNLCLFINEPFEAKMLSESRSNAVVPEWEKDWKTKSKSIIDKSFAYKWKNEVKMTEISYLQYFMEKELSRLGYEVYNDNNRVVIPLLKRVVWGRIFSGIIIKLMMIYREIILPRKNDFRSRDLKKSDG